jgi:GT2 family glycosyltransferase
MPGAWELGTPSVLVCILTRGTVPVQWAAGYRRLQIPSGGKEIFLAGMPFDHARNVGCESVIANHYKWLFFLDDDVIPPDNVIEHLASKNLDIVSGLYHRRHPGLEPVMLRNVEGGRQYITDYQPGQMVEADYVGAGCLLIHRRVLEKIEYPWFDWRCDRKDLKEPQRISEDYAFCDKARANGFKIVVDTSVQCLHAGLGAAEAGGKFSPLSI